MCPEEYGDWCWLSRMKGCGVPELCGDESASFAPAVGGRLGGVAETSAAPRGRETRWRPYM